ELSTTFHTRRGDAHAVRGVSFRIAEGEVVGLVGESGSGKTATAMSIMQLVPSTAEVTGSIDFKGSDISDFRGERLRRLRGSEIAMVFQDPMTSLNPVLSLATQFRDAMRAHGKVPRDQIRTRSEELLRL